MGLAEISTTGENAKYPRGNPSGENAQGTERQSMRKPGMQERESMLSWFPGFLIKLPSDPFATSPVRAFAFFPAPNARWKIYD
jgi:hypothetical protein